MSRSWKSDVVGNILEGRIRRHGCDAIDHGKPCNFRVLGRFSGRNVDSTSFALVEHG